VLLDDVVGLAFEALLYINISFGYFYIDDMYSVIYVNVMMLSRCCGYNN
jgi:hypothetical protein